MGEEDEAREREQLGEKRESEGRGGAGLPIMGGLGRLPHGYTGPMVQGLQADTLTPAGCPPKPHRWTTNHCDDQLHALSIASRLHWQATIASRAASRKCSAEEKDTREMVMSRPLLLPLLWASLALCCIIF